jgi:hypothetical protein
MLSIIIYIKKIKPKIRIMFSSLQYSLFIFVFISVILSAIYKEELKKHEKKHVISALFMILAICVHAVVIIVRETVIKN